MINDYGLHRQVSRTVMNGSLKSSSRCPRRCSVFIFWEALAILLDIYLVWIIMIRDIHIFCK